MLSRSTVCTVALALLLWGGAAMRTSAQHTAEPPIPSTAQSRYDTLLRAIPPRLHPLFTSPAMGPTPAQRERVFSQLLATRWRSFPPVIARLLRNQDTGWAWHMLDTLLEQPTQDMFWQIGAAAAYFQCRERLDATRRAQFRRTMRTFSPYRGDTENHYLMHFVGILLFSQEWPEMTAGEWFNGKSSRENHAEARAYLMEWIDEAARYGTTEWDSPRYLYYYLGPLLVLHDFTTDSTLRKGTAMLIEHQIADMAGEYLNGSYCGAHSRDADNSVINPRNSEAYGFAQLYLEDSCTFIQQDLLYGALSPFQCPEVIRSIAHNRTTPYAHTELRRSRAKIRFSTERYTPVYKYTWMAPEYALGSMQGGLAQPIQQHTWDVTFASRRANNTIFGLHPQVSEMELGMFFPEDPELTFSIVGATKGGYFSENKWVGGSPYERVFQHENMLIALYDIPAGTMFPHVDLFFPNTLDTLERDASGWIFCRMEDAFVAVMPLSGGGVWTEEKINRRFRIPAQPNTLTGYIVQCAARREMTWDEFRNRMRRSGTQHGATVMNSEKAPRLEMRSLGGDTFTVTGATFDALLLRRNGVPQRPDREHLFRGPFINSRYGSGVIRLTDGTRTRVLDFNTLGTKK